MVKRSKGKVWKCIEMQENSPVEHSLEAQRRGVAAKGNGIAWRSNVWLRAAKGGDVTAGRGLARMSVAAAWQIIEMIRIAREWLSGGKVAAQSSGMAKQSEARFGSGMAQHRKDQLWQ